MTSPRHDVSGPGTRGRPADRVVDGTCERLFRTGVTLPSGSALTDAQVERVGSLLAEVLNERTAS